MHHCLLCSSGPYIHTAAAPRWSRDAERTITGGFFDGKTSAEERRAYLLSVLRAGEPAAAAAGAPDAAGLNALLARSEAELAQFAALDARLDAQERAAWLAASTAGCVPSVLRVCWGLAPVCQACKAGQTCNLL